MKSIKAKIVCKDGFQFSVVANGDVMCTEPSGRAKAWKDVELGYPSHHDDLIAEYASDGPPNRRPQTYDYVPIRVIKALVRKHGGVLTATRKTATRR